MLNKILNIVLRKYHIIKINKSSNSDISLKARIDKLSKFEGHNIIKGKASISESNIGYATYIGQSSKFHRTSIGKFCSISSDVKLVAGNHPTSVFVSTHPLFFSNRTFSGLSFDGVNSDFNEYSFTNDKNEYLCEIGNDVWIGQDVIILNGVTIGNGSIIAAGSVVTKDIENYSIVGGVPAKRIKYRFNGEERMYLDKLNWWDKDINWIKNHANLFNDVDKLKEYEE